MNGHLRRSVLFMQKEPSFLGRGIQIFLTILFAAAFCQCQSAAGQEQQHQHSPSSSQSRQYHPPTPVIGGLCKLDSPDVQIGGKQTQFFLRCEPTAESAPGEGVWVVKSRNAGVTANRIPAAALVKSEQQPPQPARKSAPKTTTYTCDLVSDAYENGACSTSENCLQPVYMERSAFLQCDSTNHQWVKKHCQQGFNFDFERQACIAHTTIRPGHQFRQYSEIKVYHDDAVHQQEKSTMPPSKSTGIPAAAGNDDGPMTKGIVCTFAQCSLSAEDGPACNVGICNNGYCCSAAIGQLPQAIFPPFPITLADQQHSAPLHDATANSSSSSSSSSSPISSSPAPQIPPSILVIALDHHHPLPSAGSSSPAGKDADNPLLLLEDYPQGNAGFSLKSILGTLQNQRPYPRAEPLNELCSSGFRSPIRCSGMAGGECPPGLACDVGPKLCCPFPQPTASAAATHNIRHSVGVEVTRGGRGMASMPKWPPADGQRRRISMRRRMARRRFSSLLAGGAWCSPCLPVNLLMPANQNPFQINPNQFTANLLTDICPGGVAPLTSCASTGFCAPPLQCIQPGICCSMPAPPPIMIPPPPPPAAYACPGGLPALGQCIGGRCLSPAAVCASPGNICCAQTVVPAAIPATVCPDGTQAAGACVNNQCGAGFTCNQGLCCTNSSQTPRCLDGSQSIGACIAGKCGTGYTCTTGNICCPSQLNPCPPGQVSIGLAVNGRCPAGFTLVNGQCCGAQSNSQSQITCPEIDSTGPCDNNQQCPEPGFACDTANNWCCPQVFENEDAIGPCIQGEGGTRLCPEGYACVGEGEGECRRLDTGTCPPEEQLGPCGANNECPAGYECLEGFCCRIDNNTGRYRRKRSQQQSSAFLRLVRGM